MGLRTVNEGDSTTGHTEFITAPKAGYLSLDREARQGVVYALQSAVLSGQNCTRVTCSELFTRAWINLDIFEEHTRLSSFNFLHHRTNFYQDSTGIASNCLCFLKAIRMPVTARLFFFTINNIMY